MGVLLALAFLVGIIALMSYLENYEDPGAVVSGMIWFGVIAFVITVAFQACKENL